MTDNLIRIDSQAAGYKARAAARRSGRITPGTFIREARQRAGKSLDDVTAKIAEHYGARGYIRAELEDLEADRPGDYARLVRALHDHRAFAFDLQTFFNLAAATSASGLDEWAAA